MIVDVYDPCGILFVKLVEGVFQEESANPQKTIWYGMNGDPNALNSRYIAIVGEYLVRVRFEGMREKEESSISAYK